MRPTKLTLTWKVFQSKTFFLIWIGSSLFTASETLAWQTVVINQDGVQLKDSNKPNSRTVQTLKKGAKLTIGDKPVSGKYLARSLQAQGWVDANAVNLTKNTSRAIASETNQSGPSTSLSTSSFHKSWYLNFGIGYASPSYSSTWTQTINGLNSSDLAHMALAMDISVYFPIFDERTVIGPSLHGATDNYSKENTSLSLIHSTLSMSFLHSFSDAPSTGFFTRGDIGMSRIGTSLTAGNTQDSSNTSLGLSLMAGAGYGFSFFEKTRLSLAANYAIRFNTDGPYKVFDILLNVMF